MPKGIYPRHKKPKKICLVEDCNRKYLAKGYCVTHYHNNYRCNHPLGKFRGNRQAFIEAFKKRKIWEKIRIRFDCKIRNCNDKHYSKGYCKRHYACFIRTGNPIAQQKQHSQPEICKVQYCNKNAQSKGYCSTHYTRFKKWGSPFYVKRDFSKGSNNVNWRGGVADYPNHSLMKKQRLIILMRNPKCEMCGKPATEVHHRNGNKADHRLRNLIAICHKCHMANFHSIKKRTSKYRRLYGRSLEELAKEYNTSVAIILTRIKNNLFSIINKE